MARKSRPEALDGRLQVTAPHQWMVLAGLFAALLVVLAWALFGSVERSFAADAVLVRPGARHAVVAPVTGTVIEVLAGAGDTLEAGQAIARVRLPEAEREARITRAIVGAAAAETRPADGAAAVLHGALVAAARQTLQQVEVSAGEAIVAPHGGTLVAHRLVAGQPVRAGETIAQVRGNSADAWQALAFVAPRDAARLTAGMAAQVLVALPEQPGAGALPARVDAVSPQPVAAPEWLADLGLAPRAPAHLLRLVLDAPPPPPLADGAGARARVALGRNSPAALLLARG